MSKRKNTRACGAAHHPRASTRAPRQMPSGSPDRAISLRYELGIVRAAAEAARLLSDLVQFDSAQTAEDHRLASTAASAVLSLIDARLRLVGLALSGDFDRRLLLAAHNTTLRTGDARDGEDVLLALDRPTGRRG